MAKILVLCTHDSHLGGHGWSRSQMLKEKGHDVCFLPLHKQNRETKNYFYDLTSIWGIIIYYVSYYIRDLFVKKILLRPEKRYAFASTYLWGKSAKSILQKCPFTPEYIVLTWVPGFITPKIVRDLYEQTKAKIILEMVDEVILSLCHYHKDCDGYKDGCKNCSHVKGLKCIPRYVMSQKEKYWSDMPAEVACTTHDKNFAMQVPFLKHMNFYTSVTVPSCGPKYTKSEAREYFGISDDDFVIFMGSNNVANPEKGYPYVVEAINKMIAKTDISKRPITLLILGHNALALKLDINENVNVVRRDFLPYEHFFKAYYACDVHASATLYDSGPMMVNFAFACGRPVISFPVGVALDLIEDGKTGYMVPFKDTAAFAEGLRKIYDLSHDELEQISDKCITKIESFRDKSYWNNL